MFLKYFKLICLVVVSLILDFSSQDEKGYKYEIEVPKYICDRNLVIKDGKTTIRLSGEDALKLEYEWSVGFKGMKNCYHKQRCTLMAWRAVRDLERYLQSTSAPKKEIDINNAMLMPQLQYILNVAIKINGSRVDNKQFMLECSNETNVSGLNGTNGPRANGTSASGSNGTNAPGSNGTNTPRSNGTNISDSNEPNTPGLNEPNTPVPNEPSTPGQNELSTPGPNEPSTPGRNEPSTPGPNESNTPGPNEPNTSQSIEINTPGSNEKSPETSKNQTSETTTTELPPKQEESALNQTTSLEKQTQIFLDLLASNITYRDVTYIVNAEVIISNNNYKYHFQWEVKDNKQNLLLKETTKRSEFLVAGSLLKIAQKYIIQCSLMNLTNSSGAKAVQNFRVLPRGLILKLHVAVLVVGPQKPFKLTAFMKDSDNLDGIVQIEWSCASYNPRFCSAFKSVNSTVMECPGLPVAGRYNITVKASKGNETRLDFCEIIVTENGFVRIDVDRIREPIDPSKEIEIPVEVSDLIAGCTLQWMPVQADGDGVVDFSKIPGNLGVLTNVTLKEDEFLNEIDEFSNNTVDLDYDLKIPAPQGNWKGLMGYTSYLFRLNSTCPVLSEDTDGSEEAVLDQKSVTVYADIALKTGAPPNLNPLQVSPTEGLALKTTFQFQTSSANVTLDDRPVLYKFGYFLNDQIVFVSNLMDVTTTKSVFPFLDSGVKTVLEGCNSNLLCAQILGPIVSIKIASFFQEDLRNFMEHLDQLMEHEEYYKAFTYSTAVVQTFRNSHNVSILRMVQEHILNVTLKEAQRLLGLNHEDKYWKFLANDFIKNVRLLLDNVEVPDELINEIVALRNKISGNKTQKLLGIPLVRRSRKLLSLEQPARTKRQNDLTTLEEVKNYFIISELIITTSPDKTKVRQERQEILDHLDTFLQGLCKTLHERPQVMKLELKTVIITLEKLTKTSLNRYLHILYNENSWKINGRLKLGKCIVEKLRYNNRLCVGKVALKNYLNKKGVIFMTKIYSAESEEQEYLEDLVCDSIFVLPINEKQIEGKEAKCALWKNRWIQTGCKTLQSSNKTVQCSCNSLGFYTLEYSQVPATTVVATSSMSELGVTEAAVSSVGVDVMSKSTIYTNESISGVNFQTVVYDELVRTTIVVPEAVSTVQADDIALASLAVEGEDETVLYFLIGFSLAGIGILIYGMKRLLSNFDNKHDDNFPNYAPLYHEEMLEDVPLEKDGDM